MTTTALRRHAIVLLLTTVAATHLLAQGKNMGQAGQYYKQKTKFKFVPGPKQKGGEVRWTVAPQGRSGLALGPTPSRLRCGGSASAPATR